MNKRMANGALLGFTYRFIGENKELRRVAEKKSHGLRDAVIFIFMLVDELVRAISIFKSVSKFGLYEIDIFLHPSLALFQLSLALSQFFELTENLPQDFSFHIHISPSRKA